MYSRDKDERKYVLTPMYACKTDIKILYYNARYHWWKTSEPASSNRSTKLRFIDMPGAVIDVIIT